jgi:hypothetical protein
MDLRKDGSNNWPRPGGVLDITLTETFTPTLHQSYTFPFHDFPRQLSLYKLRETREGVVFELLLTPTCSSLDFYFYIYIHTQHA